MSDRKRRERSDEGVKGGREAPIPWRRQKELAENNIVIRTSIATFVFFSYLCINYFGPCVSTKSCGHAWLKDLCELAGFTEEIRITTYHGGKRTDVIKKKHELI